MKKKKAAQAAWDKLPPSHKREYVEAIEEAKKPETRARRIEGAVAQLAAGSGQKYTTSEKPVAEKLLIKEGHRVMLVNPPQGYKTRLGQLPAKAALVAEGPADVIQWFVANRAEPEAQLPQMKAALAPNGLLWITYPKARGRSRPTSIVIASTPTLARSDFKAWRWCRWTTIGQR